MPRALGLMGKALGMKRGNESRCKERFEERGNRRGRYFVRDYTIECMALVRECAVQQAGLRSKRSVEPTSACAAYCTLR